MMVPIPKPNSDAERPISLLQTASKVLERIVLNRLKWVVPDHNDLYGFTEGRGTTDAIAQLVSDVTRARRQTRRLHSLAVLFDLEKAFERCHLPAVLEILAKEGV